jgi:hypothetical protein
MRRQIFLVYINSLSVHATKSSFDWDIQRPSEVVFYNQSVTMLTQRPLLILCQRFVSLILSIFVTPRRFPARPRIAGINRLKLELGMSNERFLQIDGALP